MMSVATSTAFSIVPKMNSLTRVNIDFAEYGDSAEICQASSENHWIHWVFLLDIHWKHGDVLVDARLRRLPFGEVLFDL